ncbi:hypothetical protein ACFQH6_03035 [Halobacteriaceae archaeon GCM10025711]
MEPESGTDFETALRNFILAAYAEGEDVEGTFTLDSDPDDIPTWKVEIHEISVDHERGRMNVNFRMEEQAGET